MNDKQYTQEMIKNLNTRLKTKQEALKFDNTPTEGSVNPVTSEGIKAYADASKGTTYTAGENITISQFNVISAKDTKYNADSGIVISKDNVISSPNTVSGTSDEFYWKSLQINNISYDFLQGCKIKDGFVFTFDKIEWSAPVKSPSAQYIWTDGENTYYSNSSTQCVLDKATSTWSAKIWNGLSNIVGSLVWTDGENTYYSNYDASTNYILNKSTSTWYSKVWKGLTKIKAENVWSDGNNIYYSYSGQQYVLDKTTSTWTPKTWTGLTNFNGSHIWTDGTNIYYSYVVKTRYNDQYILNKETSTWRRIYWNETTRIAGYSGILGEDIWTDGENIYCFHSEYVSSGMYYRFYLIFDKSTSNWSWCGDAGLPYLDGTGNRGRDIWTDGDNIYYSYSSNEQYKLRNKYKSCQILEKVAETGDYRDLKNKMVVNPALEGNEEKLTGLKIENIKYKVPEIKIFEGGFSNEWLVKTWEGLTNFHGSYVWTDGDNIYYSYNLGSTYNYVLDKETSTWAPKTWTGLTNFNGSNVWTDGDNIYYSNGRDEQYILDKSTSTWSQKTWAGMSHIYGHDVWTDGENIYQSNVSDQYILDKATSTWSIKTWTGLNPNYGNYIWTDGENIYYSQDASQYVLDKATSTWIEKTWTGLTSFIGPRVWTDGENIYYSNSSDQYVLNKETSTWSVKTWTGLSDFLGNRIWVDGENIYYSYNDSQYQLNPNYTDADVLVKVSETGDYNDLKNKPLFPEEKTIYTYSISINKGADTITLINVQTLEALSNNLTFTDLINNIHLNTLAVEGDYTTVQGPFGFINSKSSTQFTVSFANGSSYTFASTDTLIITAYLEQSRTLYSRN